MRAASHPLLRAVLLCAALSLAACANMREVPMEHDADALPELDLDEPQEEPLSLDLDAAEEPLFKLPITVHGKKEHCGFWEGSDPAATAKEFGELHKLSPKQTGKLAQALHTEAARRTSAVPIQQEKQSDPVPDGQAGWSEARHVAERENKMYNAQKAYGMQRFLGVDKRIAAGQIAVINFYHSKFCHKICTQENGIVILCGVLILTFNCCWAMFRYKARRAQTKKNIARAEQEKKEKKEFQTKMVQECLSEEERKAFQGAMKGHLISTRKRRQFASEAKGGETGFGWTNWAAWGNGLTENPMNRDRTRL